MFFKASDFECLIRDTLAQRPCSGKVAFAAYRAFATATKSTFSPYALHGVKIETSLAIIVYPGVSSIYRGLRSGDVDALKNWLTVASKNHNVACGLLLAALLLLVVTVATNDCSLLLLNSATCVACFPCLLLWS